MGKMYVGVNNIPKNVNKIYVGVNGVARKVVKGYVGVNGVAKVFWGGSSLVENFWFFYKTANDDTLVTVISTVGDRPYIYKKFTSSITFYALISPSSYGNMYGDVLVLSTDSTGIQCGRTPYIGDTGSLTYNGITWYYGFCADKTSINPYSVDPSGCKLPSYPDATTERTQGIQDVLAKIYANDFAEDYQVGNSYNLVKADMEKTIRKFIAMYLFLNVALKESYNYPTAYELICTHVEDIVDYFLESKGNNDIISLIADYSLDGTGLSFLAYYSNSSLSNIGIDYYQPSSSNDGYDCYSSDDQITFNSWVRAQFKGDGTIDYGTPTSIQSNEYIAIGKAGYGTDYMGLSNIGLSYTSKPQPSTHWVQLANAPIPCLNGTAVVYNNEIHVFYDTLHYAFNGETWRSVSTIPAPCGDAGAVVYNGKIHLLNSNFGGLNHYSWSPGGWTQETNIPIYFYGFNNACVYQSKITLVSSKFGSYDQWRYIYQFDGSTWRNAGAVDPAVAYTSCCVYNGWVWYSGNSNSTTTSYVTKWDGSNNMTMPALPYGMYYGCMVKHDGKIHFIGSRRSGYEKYHYTWDGSQYHRENDLPYNSSNCPVVSYKGKLYMFGSSDNTLSNNDYRVAVCTIY